MIKEDYKKLIEDTKLQMESEDTSDPTIQEVVNRVVHTIDETLTQSRDYTDLEATRTLTDARDYTDAEIAKVGTGGSADLSKYRTSTDQDLIDAANADAARTHTDNVGVIVRTEFETADMKTLADAKTYTDVEVAKVSSGGTVDLSKYRTSADEDNINAGILTSANNYSDTKNASLKIIVEDEVKVGDAAVLTEAQRLTSVKADDNLGNVVVTEHDKFMKTDAKGEIAYVDSPESLKVSGTIGGAIPFETEITTSGGNQYVLKETVSGVVTESPIATEDYVDTSISHITNAANEHFKGEFSTIAGAPSTGELGDYIYVGSTGSWTEYTWTGTQWELVGAGPSGGGSAVDEKRLIKYDSGGTFIGQNYSGTDINGKYQGATSVGHISGNIPGSHSTNVGESSGRQGGYKSVNVGSNSGGNSSDNSVSIGESAGTNAGSYSINIGSQSGGNPSPIGNGAPYTISIGNHARAQHEGDILISTSQSSDPNNKNTLEVKGGKLYVNGKEVAFV